MTLSQVNKFHLVQTELAWEDPEANRQGLETRIAGIDGGIIILPEMFSTGFSMASDRLAEDMSGDTVQWMIDQSTKTNATICGSVIIKDGNDYFNRFLWVTPDQNIRWYNKRHLFRMAGEHKHYSPGQDLLQVETADMRILPQVCYDLRFPAWSRNQNASSPYDVLLYVANWPAARREQWLTLLKARAIENLCYVIAVNRIGTDGNDVAYSGDSCVIDYRGDIIESLGDADTVKSVELDLDALASYRESFPAYLDADQFTID